MLITVSVRMVTTVHSLKINDYFLAFIFVCIMKYAYICNVY